MYAWSYLISQYSYDVQIFDELIGKIVIIIRSKKFDFHGLKILITFPVMQLPYLDLFELCNTDLRSRATISRFINSRH